jgi:hypothetical protein
MNDTYNISIVYGGTSDTDKLKLSYYKSKNEKFVTIHDSYDDVMNEVKKYRE